MDKSQFGVLKVDARCASLHPDAWFRLTLLRSAMHAVLKTSVCLQLYRDCLRLADYISGTVR